MACVRSASDRPEPTGARLAVVLGQRFETIGFDRSTARTEKVLAGQRSSQSASRL
jgi:hypothetical protein